MLDHLICFGEECLPMLHVWEKEKRSVDYLLDHQSIMIRLKEIACPGDIVLVKGSRSKMMWKIIDNY